MLKNACMHSIRLLCHGSHVLIGQFNAAVTLVVGRFSPNLFPPIDIQPPGRFVPGCFAPDFLPILDVLPPWTFCPPGRFAPWRFRPKFQWCVWGGVCRNLCTLHTSLGSIK